MPIFTIETPDGRRVKIEAGDEATAVAGAQEWATANPPAQPAITADRLMGLAREQFTPPPEMQPRLEGNPAASTLPGVLGQFENSSRAFGGGFIEGLTGNLSNELVSGVLAPFDAAGAAIQGQGFDVGRSFNRLYERTQEEAANVAALNPNLNNTGNIAGAVYLGSKLAPISPTARASTPLGMAAAGALEGGVYGSVYGAGGAEGGERFTEGAKGFGLGALTGGAIGAGGSMMMQPVSQEARILSRGLQASDIAPGSVASRLAALGPDGVVADLGPTLQGQAAAIATIPGPGAKTVVDALTARSAGANARIRAGVEDALGPAPRLSQVEGEINQARQAVNAQYEPVFRAKALSDDPFVDISPVVNALDTRIGQTVGGTQSTLKSVRNLLTDADNVPIQDPQMVLAVRQELDGLIGAETNNTIKAALRDLRREIDNTLGASVPGLKDVDAQFAEVAKQGEALETGTSILNDGKTAVDPADLVEQMMGMSTGQQLRLSQGARADINRIIGTKANDRVALRNIVRGDGSWNYEKLAQVFGQDKADQLMAIIDRESQFAQLENLATSGSRTQVLKAAQGDIQGKVNDPGILREAMNFQYGNAAGKLADRVLGGLISSRREGVINNVAEALMGKGLSPQMQVELNRILEGMSPNERAIISALQTGQAAAR